MRKTQLLDVGKLEQLLERQITDEESAEIELWEKGRLLAQLVGTPAWDVVLEMLASYTANSLRDLAKTSPADDQHVKAMHSIAYSAQSIYNNFIEDVQAAIEAAKKPPKVISDQIKAVGPII